MLECPLYKSIIGKFQSPFSFPDFENLINLVSLLLHGCGIPFIFYNLPLFVNIINDILFIIRTHP